MNAPQEFAEDWTVLIYLFFVLTVRVCLLPVLSCAWFCVYIYTCVHVCRRKLAKGLKDSKDKMSTKQHLRKWLCSSGCWHQRTQVCSQTWCVCVCVQYSLSYGCKLHIHSRVTHIQTRARTHEHINKHVHTHDHLHKYKRVRRHTYTHTHTRRHALTQK